MSSIIYLLLSVYRKLGKKKIKNTPFINYLELFRGFEIAKIRIFIFIINDDYHVKDNFKMLVRFGQICWSLSYFSTIINIHTYIFLLIEHDV